MVTFIESQFPTDISYDSRGGSGFNTSVFETTAGYEQRNINWSKSRGKWDIAYGIKDRDQMDVVVGFFMAVQGKAIGFRFKDWTDYYIVNQQIGTGNGSSLGPFQIVKVYADPNTNVTYSRTINKPVNGSIQSVLVNGSPVSSSNYTVDYTTGLLTFTSGHAPGNNQPIVITYAEFDVPARFDTDELNVKQDFWMVESFESIPIVEIRL